MDVFKRYETSLSGGDMAGLSAILGENVRWHQPGNNPLSGTHEGKDAVLELLSRFMELSAGSFRLSTTQAMANGDVIATTVAFSAARAGRTELNQNGVDVFRIDGDQIAEVWLFSEDQHAEDLFWS
jgi:ketosteroid isomerase-like protein